MKNFRGIFSVYKTNKMIENLPLYISSGFILVTIITIVLFYKAASNNISVLIILVAWIGIQSAISLTGFYLNTISIPPRFIFLIGPPLLLIVILFLTKRGRKFIDGLNLKTLTWLHIVRIPVELTLLLLFLNKSVPQLMTFEGRNFDILSGLSAILVALFLFKGNVPNRRFLLVWNFICLGLLFNIVINAVLSAPFPFQQFAFDQPNIAVLYFPFVLLPGCIVPLVLFSHLASIRQLLLKK